MRAAPQLYASLKLDAPTTVPGVSKAQLIEDVAAALYASKICSYAQVGLRSVRGFKQSLTPLVEPLVDEYVEM